jgi:hypothetical protein
LSFLRKSTPNPDTYEQDARTRVALIELIYAGRAIAQYLTFDGPRDFECICGPLDRPAELARHHTGCPVGRFYDAVEAMRKVVANG